MPENILFATAPSEERLKVSIAKFFYSTPERIRIEDEAGKRRVFNGEKRTTCIVTQKRGRFRFEGEKTV